LENFAAVHALIAPERDRIEQIFIERIDDARSAGDPAVLRGAVAACWREAAETESRWLGQILSSAKTKAAPAGFRRSWARLNHVAGLPRVPATKDSAP
jgi:hypothetical protein